MEKKKFSKTLFTPEEFENTFSFSCGKKMLKTESLHDNHVSQSINQKFYNFEFADSKIAKISEENKSKNNKVLRKVT